MSHAAEGATPRNRIRKWASALVLALILAPLAPVSAAAAGPYAVQVFALNGPVCPVVILGQECPDALLPGAKLVLEQLRRGVWQPVLDFQTNRAGHADLWVKRRGVYRIDVARDDSPGIRPQPLPFFLGPVTFRVPAAHFDASGNRTTPVVVHYESGIR